MFNLTQKAFNKTQKILVAAIHESIGAIANAMPIRRLAFDALKVNCFFFLKKDKILFQ